MVIEAVFDREKLMVIILHCQNSNTALWEVFKTMRRCQNHKMIQIDQQSVTRDILLVGGTIFLFIVFQKVRDHLKAKFKDVKIAFNPLSLSKIRTRFQPEKSEVSWIELDFHDTAESSFSVFCDAPNTRWALTLFGARRLAGILRFSQTQDRLFSLSATPAQADKIISPIIRKVVSKYRDKFNRQISVLLSRRDQKDSLLTWLSNESQIYNVIYRFLDECLIVSQVSGSMPMVAMEWNDCFKVTVHWTQSDDTLHPLENMATNNPEISFEADEEGVSLTLWLAFSDKKIPPRLQSLSQSGSNFSSRFLKSA